jgi:hypothetical protein
MGFFSKIGEFFQEEVIDPFRETIDPILPEAVKESPAQSIGALIAAPFTGGASLAALAPQAISSGLGQVGVDVPTNITNLLSSLLLGGTALGPEGVFGGTTTLPGFGAGGAGTNLFQNLGIPGFGQGGRFGQATQGGNVANLDRTVATIMGQPVTFGQTLQGAGGSFDPALNFGLGGVVQPSGGGGLLQNIGNLLKGPAKDFLSQILGGGGAAGGVAGTTGTAGGGGAADLGFLPQGRAELQVPSAPPIRTAADIFGEAQNLLGPFEPTQEFFEGFGPTSLEEAVANKFFQDRLEQAQRKAGQIASLAGIPNLAPTLFTRDIGPTVTSIGSALANISQQRAGQALSGRLAGLGQFTDIGRVQSNLGAQLGLQQQFRQSQEQQLREQQRLGEQSAERGLLTTGIGGGIGALLGQIPFLKDLGIGAGTGATLGGIFGGGTPLGQFPSSATTRQQTTEQTGVTQLVDKLNQLLGKGNSIVNFA